MAKVFDAPGKATAWGMAGCGVCSAVQPDWRWALIITIVAALAGCFNG